MDPSKIYVCATALPDDAPDSNMVASPSGAGSLAMPLATFWPNGKRLRVQFIRGGTEKVRKKVMYYAQLWEKYANIDFQFVETGPADIRISFDQGAGSWSQLGTNAKNISQDKPTMNFGWFNDDTREEEFSRTTVHEFGHALGCIHEHQSPNVKINWDEEKVYKYYQGPPNNWSRAKVEHNLLKPYDGKTTIASDYDERSVMLYFFPPSLTTDGKGTPSNHTLSPQDKLFISMMYPFQTRSSGTWSISESRPWYPAVAVNIKQVVFNTPYLETPRIAMGLNELDVDESRNLRVKVYNERVTEKDFVLRIDSWSDTLLYGGGATWVEFEESDSSYQVGRYELTKPTGAKNATRVRFSQTFEQTPRIVVWISGMDMHKDRNIRIKAYADKVDNNGFDIHLDTWGDTVMYSASASWIAYDPVSNKTVSSGSDDTSSYRSWFPAQKANGRKVPYGNRCQKVPQVYVAISSMDFDAARNVRFKVTASDITEESFKWNVDTQSDTLCYKAGVDWIAFE